MFGNELVPVVRCCTNEYQVSYVKSVCFDMFVGSWLIPILVVAEKLRYVIPVGQETSEKLSGLYFHSALGSCGLREVVLEVGVVAVGKIVRRKVRYLRPFLRYPGRRANLYLGTWRPGVAA